MVGKSPAKQLICRRSIRGRYLSWRSITYRPRAITSNNAARKKVLQKPTIRAVRAMRAVFCRTLRQKIVLLATLRSTDLDHGPPNPSQTPLKPRRGTSTTRGP